VTIGQTTGDPWQVSHRRALGQLGRARTLHAAKSGNRRLRATTRNSHC
jgi:hypothetical protein